MSNFKNWQSAVVEGISIVCLTAFLFYCVFTMRGCYNDKIKIESDVAKFVYTNSIIINTNSNTKNTK